MIDEFFDNAVKVFKLDEGDGKPGREGMPYRDSKGLWTIGRGHLIGKDLTDLRLSESLINEMFREDLAQSTRDAILVLGHEFFGQLSPARKLAVISMLFTLGRTKFMEFEQTLAAMKRYDWQEVSSRILAAKWARDVDPQQRHGLGRDDRIAFMFRTGEFHPDYGVKE